jgi:hypothetical protein
MINRKMKTVCVFAEAILLLAMVNGCSSLPQFASRQCTKPIIVDGDKDEWIGAPAYINKENTIAVSICHDAEYLYLCLTSQDPETQMQIMRNGLTIWFDKKGSNNKTFGINFPLAKKMDSPPPAANRERMRDPEEARKMMEQSLFELEIVGEKETDRYRLAVNNEEGIRAKIDRGEDNLLIYELQVPFKKTPQHPNAIELADGSFVGLGVEAGTMENSQGKKRSERGDKPGGHDGNGPPSDGGGMELGGGGPPGGSRMSQGRPQGSGEKTEILKMWWKVKMN